MAPAINITDKHCLSNKMHYEHLPKETKMTLYSVGEEARKSWGGSKLSVWSGVLCVTYICSYVCT